MLSTPVQAAADWAARLTGARRALLAVFAGAISVLAFAPIHAWPVLFLSFGLLVWLLDGCHACHAELRDRLKCAALTGFWFGFGYFLTGLYWIAEAFLVEPWRHGWLIPFVMTALPGGMALFYAAAAALAMMLWRPGPARVFALAIAFGLAEYARGHILTGLPWNLLGYGLAATLPMMQAAALFGVYALSLLAVLTLRQSLRHLGAARLRARAVQRHCVADARLLCCACARRGMGRGAASERRYGEHRRAASHRAG